MITEMSESVKKLAADLVANQLAIGDMLPVSGYQKLKNLRFVRNGGSDATLVVDYYRG
jgi:hypothetical protein